MSKTPSERRDARSRGAQGKSPGPLMAARRCDGRHIKQALSPHQGGGDMGRGAGGGSGTLGSVRLGARSPCYGQNTWTILRDKV